MVKPPRHSKPKTETVTIDLDEKDVQQVKPDQPATKADSQPAKAAQNKPVNQSQKIAPKADKGDPQTAQTQAETSPKTASNRSKTPQDEAKKPSETSKNPSKMTEKAPQSAAKTTPSGEHTQSKPDGKLGTKTTDTTKPKTAVSALIASALMGGVISLGGFYGLQQFGLLQGPDNTQNELDFALSGKISDLEARLSELGGLLDQGSQVDMVSGLAPVITRMDDLETLVQNDNEGALAALSDINGRLESLTNRIVRLENRPSTSGSADGAALSLPADVMAQISQLADTQKTMQATIQDNMQGNVQAQNNDELAAQTADNAAQLADLESRLEQTNAKVETSGGALAIARSLAVANIQNAIARGGIFINEINVFEQIDPDHGALTALKPIAQNGVLSRNQLIAQFDDVADQILATERQVSDDDSIMNRLMNSASSIVKVRQIGDIEGDTITAIVARLETRLKADQFEEAIAQWETLPEAAKSASQSYIDHVVTRMTAENLINQLMIGN